MGRRAKKTQFYHKGAQSDVNIVLSALDQGRYLDAQNMRSFQEGDFGVLKKIEGETSEIDVSALFDTIGASFPNDYKSIGGVFVNDHNITFWASTHAAPEQSAIIIDGDIMCWTSDLTFNDAYPLQIDKNENAYGGEVFLNDLNHKPLIFSIQDIIDEYGDGTSLPGGTRTEKYFDDFNIELYHIQPTVQLNQPVFIEVKNVGGVNGLAPGSYAYSMRYVDDDGNGTVWGPSTPMIPVPGNESFTGYYYTGVGTHGLMPDPSGSSNYGIKLRIRVMNKNNYSYIELRRVAHIDGQAMDFVPQAQKITVSEVNIRENPYSYVEFIDSKQKVWTSIDEFEDEESPMIDKVNAIAYFKSRLTMHSPTYLTKDVDTTDLFLGAESGKLAYPILQNLKGIGFNNIRNQVYKKSLMHGEKYGWHIQFHNDSGGKMFVVGYKSGTTTGLDDFTNYQMPNRRDVVSLDTMDNSDHIVYAATTGSNDGASVNGTHEIFDNSGIMGKMDIIPKNIYKSSAIATYFPFTPTGYPGGGTTVFGGNKYNEDGHWYRINDRVAHSNAAYYDYPDYKPLGWPQRVLSQGMQFEGIDATKLPSYVKSFSIVRTKPAGRVICQGIGYYSLIEQTGADSIHKNLNKLWFYSPDIDSNIGININVFDDLINNPTAYKIQLVSPVGIFSEVYSGKIDSGSGNFFNVDIINYAKILYENNLFNYGDGEATVGWQDGYVSFGRWRNDAAAGNSGMSNDIFTSTDLIFDLLSANINGISGKEGRSKYLELTVDENIYLTEDTYDTDHFDVHFDDDHVHLFHEPLYIINIINTEADIPDNNVDQFVDIGHFQNLESIIGLGYGVDDKYYELVDERVADCIANYPHCHDGTHTGANNAITLTDASASWGSGDLSGWHIYNITDGSWAVVSSNTSTTITAKLIGGTGSDWDTNDVYVVYAPTGYIGTGMYSQGYHTGASDASVLTDTSASWVVDELKGYSIRNITDGSTGIIASNTGSSVTLVAGLSGGTDNDFDANDRYQIYENKYIYVDGKPWLTNVPLGQYSAITTAFTNTGYYFDGNRNVYGLAWGMFQAAGVGGSNLILFSKSSFLTFYGSVVADEFYIPAEGVEISVRYDNRSPIQLFGGDTFIGDALFVPIDCQGRYNNTIPTQYFNLHLGLPYFIYRQYDTLYQLYDNSPPSFVATGSEITLDHIRQLACLFTCESKLNLQLLFNESFPKKNYVMRPLFVDDGEVVNGAEAVYADHDVFPEYIDDYGDEYLTWLYGGFHFPVQSNIDYSKMLNDRFYFSKPDVGFTEKLYFPDNTIYSLNRINPGEIDSLKFFPATNVFRGSDFSGEIKFAFVANSSKGDNLYKITKRGVCVLLVDKNIIREFSGGEIGVIGSSESSFIQAEYWLSKIVGLNDQMWRSVAINDNMAFFANDESVYQIVENELIDIAREFGYHKSVYDKGISKIQSGYSSPVNGAIDWANKEYWFYVFDNVDPNHIKPYVFVFNYVNKLWNGYFTHQFDSVFSDKLKLYSVRDIEIYKLNSGFDMQGDAVIGFVIQSVNPQFGSANVMHTSESAQDNLYQASRIAEYESIEISSDHKPVSVSFSKELGEYPLCSLDNSLGQYYLKDYGFWTNKIPRQSLSGFRLQGKVLVFNIMHNISEPFTLISTTIEYKILRLQ